jgi:hypothetical protein
LSYSPAVEYLKARQSGLLIGVVYELLADIQLGNLISPNLSWILYGAARLPSSPFFKDAGDANHMKLCRLI